MPRALRKEPLRLCQEEREEGNQRGFPQSLRLRDEGGGGEGVRSIKGGMGSEVHRPQEHVRKDGRQHLLLLWVSEGDPQKPLYEQRHRRIQRKAEEGDEEADPDELRGQRDRRHHGDLQKLQQLEAR